MRFLPRKVGGKVYAILTEDFRDLSDGRTAQAGMPTDGMSSMRPVYAIWPPYSNGYLAECLIHDHDCYLAAAMPPGRERNRERLAADMRFRRNLRRAGAYSVTAARLYCWVRIGAATTARRDASPLYAIDPEGAYRALGILDQARAVGLFPWSSEMRMGGRCY